MKYLTSNTNRPIDKDTAAKMDAAFGCLAASSLMGIVFIISSIVAFLYFLPEIMESMNVVFVYSINHPWVGKSMVITSFIGIVYLVKRQIKMYGAWTSKPN